MKDLTLCVVCVILGILLSMLFKQACGCKNVVEGLGLGEGMECGLAAFKKANPGNESPGGGDEYQLEMEVYDCKPGLTCSKTTNKCVPSHTVGKKDIVKFNPKDIVD